METTLIESKIQTTIAESKKISYEEFLELCDEDTLAEWVNGEIIMASPASLLHQELIGFLWEILNIFVKYNNLGKVIFAPFQMKIPYSGREPDIIFVHSSHLDRLKETYLDGPADVAIEIISKESIDRDRIKKFNEYESAGIPEYWLIDPMLKQAEFYRIGADSFYHPVSLDAEGKYHSEAIQDFWFKVSWLWQEPLPPDWEIRKELNISLVV